MNCNIKKHSPVADVGLSRSLLSYVKYVGSIPTWGAILLLLSGCAGAYITKEQMVIGAVGRSYIKSCREPIKENAITAMATTITSTQPEMRRWARVIGDSKGNFAATTLPLEHERYCVEIGNNTPPSGFWGKFVDLLASLAPYVAAGLGIAL